MLNQPKWFFKSVYNIYIIYGCYSYFNTNNNKTNKNIFFWKWRMCLTQLKIATCKFSFTVSREKYLSVSVFESFYGHFSQMTSWFFSCPYSRECLSVLLTSRMNHFTRLLSMLIFVHVMLVDATSDFALKKVRNTRGCIRQINCNKTAKFLHNDLHNFKNIKRKQKCQVWKIFKKKYFLFYNISAWITVSVKSTSQMLL